MLGEVPGNNDDKVMKQVQIRDLSFYPDQVPVNDPDQAPGLEEPDRPKERRPAATWLLRDLVGLWIYLAVIGPDPEQPENDLALARCKAELAGHKRPDLIMSFVEDPDRYASVIR